MDANTRREINEMVQGLAARRAADLANARPRSESDLKVLAMYRDFIRYLKKLSPEVDDDDVDKVGFTLDHHELFRYVAAFMADVVLNSTPVNLVEEDDHRISMNGCERSMISWVY